MYLTTRPERSLNSVPVDIFDVKICVFPLKMFSRRICGALRETNRDKKIAKSCGSTWKRKACDKNRYRSRPKVRRLVKKARFKAGRECM